MDNRNRTKLLVEGAMMIALATILSFIKVYELPQGGSITLEMLPLVIMGLRNGGKWGCFTGLVHGILQMILGIKNVLYCTTLLSMLGCTLLDYLVAFTVLGLAGVFAKPFKNKLTGIVVGSVIAGLLRFACSFLSGFLIWGGYAPSGQSAVIYSLTYNGSYMIPNIIILAIIAGIIYKIYPKMFNN